MSLTTSILTNMKYNGSIKKDICSTTYTTPFKEYTIDISNIEELDSMFSDVSLGRNICVMTFKDSIKDVIELRIPLDAVSMLLDNFYVSLCENHPSKYVYLYIDQETTLDKMMGLYIPDNPYNVSIGLWEIGVFDYNRQSGEMTKRVSFQSTSIGITDFLDALYYVMFFDMPSHNLDIEMIYKQQF